MSTTTNRAIGAGLLIVAVAIGGAATWRHQHPDGTPFADLASVLPKIPQLDPKKPDAPVPPRQPGEASLKAPSPKDDAAPGVVPHFDVARVEPTGDAVVAGTGAPNTKVALLAAGKVLAEAQSDANGQFVLLPPPLMPGDQTLTLRQSPAGRAVVESAQKLMLSVPRNGRGQVVIALAEPGKSTRMLSAPVPGAAPASLARTPATPPSPAIVAAAPPSTTSGPPTRMAIQSTTTGNGDAFQANGVAAPGTPIHLYLNNSHLADVVAGRDGQWRVVIRKGLAGGHYAMRADAVSPGNHVTKHVEVPFDVPFAAAATSVSPADSRKIASRNTDVAVAEAPPADAGVAPRADPHDTSKTTDSGTADSKTVAAAVSSASPPSDPATAIIDAIETHQVFGGDNLWNISRVQFGDGTRFPQIYAANAAQIRDPNLIYPGQVFVLPRK